MCCSYILTEGAREVFGSVPVLPMVWSLLHACLHSVFELPEKYVFGGSYKGVKHKIFSLLFMFSQISQMQLTLMLNTSEEVGIQHLVVRKAHVVLCGLPLISVKGREES